MCFKKIIYGVNKNICFNLGIILERRGDGGILLKVVVVIYLGVAILFIFYFLFVYDYVELNDYGFV